MPPEWVLRRAGAGAGGSGSGGDVSLANAQLELSTRSLGVGPSMSKGENDVGEQRDNHNLKDFHSAKCSAKK